MGKGGGGGGGFLGTLQGAHQSWTGVSDQAQAAGGAARAAEAQARANRAELAKEGKRLVDLAGPSVTELSAVDASLAAGEKQIAADEKLFASIDPSLLEASNQVLNILKGGQSSAGGAFDSQRAIQRQKLLASLREQLGPGAETSTAGIQALTRFDSETGQLAAGVRESSLNNLMGLIGTGRSIADRGRSAQSMQASFDLKNSLVGRQLQAGQLNLNALMGGNQDVMNTVGSQYTEQLIRGRGQQQDHNTGVQFMSSIWGGKWGGKGK